MFGLKPPPPTHTHTFIGPVGTNLDEYGNGIGKIKKINLFLLSM